MPKSSRVAGYFPCGLPYNRSGVGREPLVIFQGLMFENKPLPDLTSGMFNSFYKFLEQDYTIYIVNRRPGLAAGCTMKDMADDYAAMIREEFGGPMDLIGVSTGGSIVQHFAADHPDLVRRLIIHSSAYTLSEKAKEFQLTIGRLAGQHKWREAYEAMAGLVYDDGKKSKILAGVVVWLGARLAVLAGVPKDPSDLVISIQAEDAHNFKDRLGEIRAPTLVAAGEKDPFYTPTLFRETAEGIPNARLCLYPGMSHPAAGKPFEQDVLAFLKG